MSTQLDTIEDLIEILELEYGALLEGDLDKIAQYGAEKNRILAQVSELNEVEMQGFAFLKPKLSRNQLLTESALNGMRIAVRRLKEVRQVHTVLHTYTANGQKTCVLLHKDHKLSKRS